MQVIQSATGKPRTDSTGPSRTRSLKEPIPALEFFAMADLKHQRQLLKMMRKLYREDVAASPVNQSRFSRNIQFLVEHPSNGRVVLFTAGGTICGYALLIPYWSNEFGGALLYIDELFVTPEARGRGIGTRFFRYLDETRPFDAVALALEVSPGNTRARRLYQSLGFDRRRNAVLTRRFPRRVHKKGRIC